MSVSFTMARMDKRTVEEVIECEFEGNKTAAARAFGTSRQTVYDWLARPPDADPPPKFEIWLLRRERAAA